MAKFNIGDIVTPTKVYFAKGHSDPNNYDEITLTVVAVDHDWFPIEVSFSNDPNHNGIFYEDELLLLRSAS